MQGHDLLIIDEDIQRNAEEVLRTLLIESQSKCGLLINHDGSLLCQQGEVGSMDVTSLAALAAAGFAATQEMARLIGEPEFSVLFHQGEHEHIYVSLVGDEALMMMVFDDRTTIGLVRVLSKEACKKLDGIFANVSRR